ncbi:MAG TPA: S-methyl-5-thioribose-1-phosphate isomerase [Nitrososphaeraceae archaeon]
MKSNKDHTYDSLVTLTWKDNAVVLIDQTKLPGKLVYRTFRDYTDVAKAIKKLMVRGAPAIGVAGAMGLALACTKSKASNKSDLIIELQHAYDVLRLTRPTAINLLWALERIMKISRKGQNVKEIQQKVVQEVLKMAEEDVEINRRMGKIGSGLFRDGETVMTHCNAGSLATVGYGTALGVIRAVKESGKSIKVIATETRPVMQGSRLTAFELQHDGIDVSLVPDTGVGILMARGGVKRIIVGADRILRTGHVFNKIGTYQIAILAGAHKIPFYVAAPLSTFDLKSNVEEVVIEERDSNEVSTLAGKRIVPRGINIFNPAFDLTPPHLITAIITEKGLLKQPLYKAIRNVFRG